MYETQGKDALAATLAPLQASRDRADSVEFHQFMIIMQAHIETHKANVEKEKVAAIRKLQAKKRAEQLAREKAEREARKRAEEARRKAKAEAEAKRQAEAAALARQQAERQAEEEARRTQQVQATASQKEQVQAKAEQVQEEQETTSNVNSIKVTLTAYTATCKGCTGITATGIDVRNTVYYQGMRVVATDPNVIPMYSILDVHVNGQVVRCIAMDKGGAIKGNKMDYLVESVSVANSIGRQQNVQVDIIKRGR